MFMPISLKIRTPSSTKRFSLIELLVVIAIIGILASLLLPSLKKARESAKQSACTNNQKQIAIAITMYQGDNDSYYPYSSLNNSVSMVGDPSYGSVSFDDMLGMGYDGREMDLTTAQNGSIWPTYAPHAGLATSLYTCASDALERTTTITVPRTYSLNAITGGNILGISGYHTGGNYTTPVSANYNDHIFGSADTIVMRENMKDNNVLGNHNSSIGNPRSLLTNGVLPHGVKSNYLYADGHAATVNYYSTMIRLDNSSSRNPDGYDFRGTAWQAIPKP
ncbi:DUF1559 domain-containing protein [Lentisphaera marina]|uniref:DUF1559 family PulG-like putative transporter n=1 Tax=Lentisphaera marina TaxID=1111041 RepID=UPI00236658F5|nr:DUF1559 domain-containing protein [Lentisphaera marina]MDD7984025.1 DUF1559 domain-containing protein [Lentisphaera marina]